MLKDKNMQLSIYSLLYDKLPENHILKLIKDAVDFSCINKLLEKSYCKYYGRPAKEPELMVKLLRRTGGRFYCCPINQPNLEDIMET